MNGETVLDYSVVVPMKDEEANVAPLVDEVAGVLGGLGSFEMIVVDDGSTDGTWQALQAQKGGTPELRAVRLDRNHGQSTALWAGLERVRGAIVITMDGDCQNDPNDIPKLLAEIEGGADVCLTWRANRQDSWWRRVQSRVGNGVRNWVLASSIIDTGSQLRAFRAACRDGLIPFDGMHRFMGNLFMMHGCRVAQIPTNHRARRAGVAKYGMRGRTIRGLKDVLAVRWMRGRTIRYGVEHDE